MGRRAELGDLYSLLGVLKERCGGYRELASCDGRMGWPRRGVYFFFELGEVREDGATPRVVRVGTHALRPSRSTLWRRLAQHRGYVSGQFPGGGDHRGSIFRLHVGTALLECGGWPDSIKQTWGVGRTADLITRTNEFPLERAVSDHIRRMPFLWVEIDDPAGPKSERGTTERGAISLLSNVAKESIDPPSQQWLGQFARAQAVRHSGLWNVNHVSNPIEVQFLSVLESHIRWA